eukprot:3922414-Amphidinium_carterae.1
MHNLLAMSEFNYAHSAPTSLLVEVPQLAIPHHSTMCNPGVEFEQLSVLFGASSALTAARKSNW